MLRKDEKVEVTNVDLGKRSLPWKHAERLLNATYNNGLWVLPKDSKYSLEDGKLVRTSAQRDNQGSKE